MQNKSNHSSRMKNNRLNKKSISKIGLNSVYNNSSKLAENGGLFQKTISPILVLGQMFGVMLVCGITSQSISDLKFKWKSKRTIYSLIIASILFTYTLVLLRSTFYVKLEFTRIATRIFYVTNVSIFFCFLALSSKWPKLMMYWTEAERKLPTFRSLKQKRRCIFKIQFLAFGIFICAFVESALYFVSQVHFYAVCEKRERPIRYLAVKYVPHIYENTDNMTIIEAFGVIMIGITATFVWVFMDIFIMTIGIILTTQFKLFNDELKQTKNEKNFWSYRRAQYARLRELVSLVDETINHLTFIFQSLNPLPTPYRIVFFWYSLASFIMRIAAVSFSLTSINDESKKSTEIMRMISTHLWNMDADRFFNDVTSDFIALTGMRFFSVTRNMILSVIGTIVTYELVLMQFNLKYNTADTC